MFVLVIENTGPTVARNVRIRFNPPLERVGETSRPNWKPIRNSLLLTNGIALMPPGRRMEWFFDLTHERFASTLPMQYTATVEADGPFGAVETLTYKIDMAVYGGINRLGAKTTHDGVKALEELVKATGQLANTLSRSERPLPPPESAEREHGEAPE
ncbi:hypothetical protein GCM10009727_85820 [Actinomadura napierensis]|uniref:SRPBCC family protein n=1 Tax=Actinomadura napierensis TaxID=267854 RepID=A0ABN3AFW4_9ACTN